MRAALTILGVAIGVTVVMVIGALISGFNKGISDMLGSLGPKTFWVGRYWGGQDEDPEDPDPWRRRPPVTIEEARRLEELPTIAFVVVDENTLADINFEGHTLSAINVRGRDADWPMIEGGHIHPGRSFSHLEDAANSHVAVVNTKLAENLFGQRDAIARRIKIGGVPYDVVAAMMSAVTSRTRESGVRKALGATRREILWQFLFEAATLTLVGGIVGMAVGWLVSLVLAKATPVPSYVPIGSVVLALGLAAFTGLLFGILPARKAARLDPVEALRYE